MIDAAGYFDWAIQVPGPPSAVNGSRNGGKGIIPHSAEGYFHDLDALRDFLWARGTAAPGLRASWGATNLKDGRFVQHYSIHSQTWTSGAPYPNNNFFAFENEGVAGEPLTQAQVDNIIRVGRELMALQGWTATRPVSQNDLHASCYEHTECVRWGAAATACPSGRIPWDVIVPALNQQEDDEMTERVWDGSRTWIVGKGGSSLILYPEFDKPFIAIYGPHSRVMSAADLEKIKV